jgi:hypothetical protein
VADDAVHRQLQAVAGSQMQVAAADAGAADFDQHLAGFRHRVGPVLDDQGRAVAGALEYGCFHDGVLLAAMAADATLNDEPRHPGVGRGPDR